MESVPAQVLATLAQFMVVMRLPSSIRFAFRLSLLRSTRAYVRRFPPDGQ
jgi:hypothetical protein